MCALIHIVRAVLAADNVCRDTIAISAAVTSVYDVFISASTDATWQIGSASVLHDTSFK